MPAGTVTFLLTDIEGSSRNWEASQEDMRTALRRHDGVLNTVIDEHGGIVLTERGEGDSFFAVFTRASDAVAAAAAVQRRLSEEAWPEATPMKVRMAIHTGEAGGDYRGPEVNRCARLRAVAHGGQVLISGATEAVVRRHLPGSIELLDLGQHRLRDLTQPEHVFQVCIPDLDATFPPLVSLELFRQNLPIQLTSFVGRAHELSEVASLLSRSRSVTLIGAGGCGKTRLALQAAADALPGYRDGVWFIDLAPLTEPNLLPNVVATTLGVREVPDRPLQHAIAEHIAKSKLLLILDNCEHLIASAAAFAEGALRAAPDVRILATSREPLGIAGEAVWRVPSLSLPADDGSQGHEDPSQAEAVRLFTERAVATQPSFELTPQALEIAIQICRRLDGLPLAIELAAARLRMMSPQEILAHLEDRFALLTGGNRTALERQKTLQATVDWSHDLLGPGEQALFRRLAVFAGGFDLEAVEGVCVGTPLAEADLLQTLGLLVDKSLVANDAISGVVRYRLLETLREYAHERLVEVGEEELLREAHLTYFIGEAERAYAERVERADEWLLRLELDHDNFRAALDQSRQDTEGSELRLAGALGWFWDFHSHRTEGRERLERALARSEGTSPTRARALWGAGALAIWQGDITTALLLQEEGLAMWRELGDQAEVALALWYLGWAHFLGGDDDGALPLWEESLKIARQLRNPRLVNRASLGVCQIEVARGRVDEAAALAEQGLREGIELHDPWAVHFAHHFLGDCDLIRGDFLASERHYADSLRAGIEMGDIGIAGGQLQGIAMASAGQGRYVKALRLDAASEQTMAEYGIDPSGIRFWQALRARHVGRAASEIGDEAASAARQTGRAMGFRAAADYALDHERD